MKEKILFKQQCDLSFTMCTLNCKSFLFFFFLVMATCYCDICKHRVNKAKSKQSYMLVFSPSKYSKSCKYLLTLAL